MANPDLKSPVECQRFFALSKRVPKDVKRYCGICRQHGMLMQTRGHVCIYKDCNCSKCALVRSRRQVMSQQIRLRRAQDKRFQRTSEPTEADLVPLLALQFLKDSPNFGNVCSLPTSPTSHCNGESFTANNNRRNTINIPVVDQQQQQEQNQNFTDTVKNMCYFCQKCKNHGILVWKKQHKRQCPFVECECEKCDLIETRRKLDQHIKKRKSNQSANNSLAKRKNNLFSNDEKNEQYQQETIKVKLLERESICDDTPSTSFNAPSVINCSRKTTSSTSNFSEKAIVAPSPFQFSQLLSYTNTIAGANGLSNKVAENNLSLNAGFVNSFNENMPAISTFSENSTTISEAFSKRDHFTTNVLTPILTTTYSQPFDSNKPIWTNNTFNQNYGDFFNEFANNAMYNSKNFIHLNPTCNDSQNLLKSIIDAFYNFITENKVKELDNEKVEQHTFSNTLLLKKLAAENHKLSTLAATAPPVTIPFTETTFNNCSSDPILDQLLKKPILQLPNNFSEENLLKSNRELEHLLAIRALNQPNASFLQTNY